MTVRSCSLPRFQRIGTVLSLSLFFAAASPALAGQAPRTAAPDPLLQMNEAIDALTRKVWPSVVQILVTSYGPRDEGPQGGAGTVVGMQQSTGSGFVIDPDGYILTNAHVVNSARRIQIVLPADNADGRLATALSGKTYVMDAR